jgi:hypothetical protein
MPITSQKKFPRNIEDKEEEEEVVYVVYAVESETTDRISRVMSHFNSRVNASFVKGHFLNHNLNEIYYIFQPQC